jgi:AcrR family transcriptional regulator
MRLRDENKRKLIIQTAGRLFSEQPFHKVRLEDVADSAGVGKGTVYIYFKNKEDLYYNLVLSEFAEMVKRSEERLAMGAMSPTDKLRAIVEVMIDHLSQHPQVFKVMRTLPVPDASSSWDATRQDMAQLITAVVREGVASGEFVDPRPDLTGLYLMAMVRAIFLYIPNQTDIPSLKDHLWNVLSRGIVKANG